MGRYTTVQTYSDNNPKLVHVSYDQAKGSDGPGTGKLQVDKTENVMGSCAGAGSGEFHMYRAHRRREMHRMAALEEELAQDEARANLEAVAAKGREECEERTRKKAEKRKRRKEKKGHAKKLSTAATASSTISSSSSPKGGLGVTGEGNSGKDEGATDDEQEFVYIRETGEAVGDVGSGKGGDLSKDKDEIQAKKI
ncbi:unnamed protein product [Choristocarpus tenellus]